MSIKTRLWLSYLFMLLVPAILTVIVGLLVGNYYISDYYNEYESLKKVSPIGQIIHDKNFLTSEIKKLALQSPENFTDEGYLKKLDEELEPINGGIIVRKDDQIIHVSPILGNSRSLTNLPKYGEFVQEYFTPHEKYEKGLILNQHDYVYQGSKFTIFYAAKTAPLKKAIRGTMITITLFVIAILLLTNGTLTYIVAGSITKPLGKLKEMANRIKDGELNFKIEAKGKDEIGEVSRAFEEMRERLKSSIDLQLQYEENRKELIANISHDLKTPITAIKGYVEGIRDGVADTPEKMAKYINTIYSKSVDIDRLINDLLLFSKLDLNKLELDLKCVDIGRYMMDIVDEMSFELEKKDIAIELHNNLGEAEKVAADVIQLKRVLVNIFENSVKYMGKETGRVDVWLSHFGEYVKIEIKDSGQGISKEALPYIFDRFYREDTSRNSTTGGSGLGLSIAKKIIEEQGGSMWAESAEGQGSSIFFTLKHCKDGDVI